MKAFARLLISAMATIKPPSSTSAFQLAAGNVILPTNKLSISYVENQGEEGSGGGPTTLFIHGLDSSSQTWRGVQQSLATPSLAIDCRGCGRSDLGNPDDFSPDALVEDIKMVTNSHPLLRGGKKPFVLVGHSMGGRVAMEYAAKYPDDISALVIEDMDIRRRSVDSNFIPNFDEAKAVAFERSHETLDGMKRELEGIGYSSDMYSKWIGEGRIYEYEDKSIDHAGGKNKFWSDVNPAFRALCYRRIFDSDCGTNSWNAIARNLQQQTAENGNNDEEGSAKVHLMVAGIGTVCDEDSIEDMRKAMIPGAKNEEKSSPLLSVKTYAQGTHSIHNSAREEFMADLERIIDEAKQVSEANSRL